MTEVPNERDLFYSAIDRLNAAYKELGDAADDLRGIVSTDFLDEIGMAKRAINRAKDVIGA